MNFQTGPAETTNYLILGYLVIFGVILIHLGSLRQRLRNAQNDLEALDKFGRKRPRKSPTSKKKRK